MSKIFEKLLQDFKKANTSAREKLAEKYGFKNTTEYEKYLNGKINGESAIVTKKKGKKKADKIEVEVKVEVKTAEEVKDTPTDMVIAFDTTGSMRSYIGAVRTHVQQTVANLFENVPNLRLKLVAFGDYCDMTSATNFGKAYQETYLTADKDSLIQFVRGALDTGGGDAPEFYELVLKKILDETPWRKGSNRTILLIADDQPHEVGYTLHPFVTKAQIDWRVEATKAAALKVRVDTLRINPSFQWYAELSRMTEGTCMNFSNAARTQEIVEASTYFTSRSEKSMGEVRARYRGAVEKGDDELIGAYKGMGATYGINLDE